MEIALAGLTLAAVAGIIGLAIKLASVTKAAERGETYHKFMLFYKNQNNVLKQVLAEKENYIRANRPKPLEAPAVTVALNELFGNPGNEGGTPAA
jgi:hypothetical protein